MKTYHARNLDLPFLRHAYFGRQGGVSQGLFATLNAAPTSSDRADHVLENRRRIRDWFGGTCDFLTMIQYHSAEVATVDAPWTLERMPRADAMVTNRPNIVLGLTTADCAPVLFVDPEARVIGAAHAGWKGARIGVCEATIAAMEAIGAASARIRAAIGPCIAQKSYEVGPEFRVRYPDSAARFFKPSPREGHFLFDNEGYIVSRLAAAGIADIEAMHADTYAREDEFYSFRRSTIRGEPDYGREISAIMLTD